MTVRTWHHGEVAGYTGRRLSIRKIRVIRGLDPVPTSLPVEGVSASPEPGAENRGRAKPKNTSGLLSLALIDSQTGRTSQK